MDPSPCPEQESLMPIRAVNVTYCACIGAGMLYALLRDKIFFEWANKVYSALEPRDVDQVEHILSNSNHVDGV